MRSLSFLSLFLFSMSVLAQDFVVFKSKGGQFPPGMAVKSGDIIQLGAGEYVKFITPSGKVVEVKGPHNKALDMASSESEKGIAETLKILVAAQQKHTKDMGVTRDSTAVIRAANKIGWVPEPWVVNISYDGDKCVREGDAVKLWRAEQQDLKLKVAMGQDFEAIKVLKQGETYINAPTNMPIKDGGKYQFEYGDKMTQSTLHVIPKTITSPAVLAAWMKESGCRAQAVSVLTAK